MRTRIEICSGDGTRSLVIDDPSTILETITAVAKGRPVTIVKVDNKEITAKIDAKIKHHLREAENDAFYAGTDTRSVGRAGYEDAENERRKARELETELMLHRYWKVTLS